MQLYIENRIKQNPYNSKILQMSTPVICFGNIFNSHVATLGLNPSNKEFVDDNNAFLSGMKLRFQDCFSLSQNDLTKLKLNQTELVLRYCLEYFNNPNPYGEWFDYLERHVLSKLDISYYNGSCCHLDLVQWATPAAPTDNAKSTNRRPFRTWPHLVATHFVCDSITDQRWIERSNPADASDLPSGRNASP